MSFKEFIKPSWKKIIIFIILIGLVYFSYYVFPKLCDTHGLSTIEKNAKSIQIIIHKIFMLPNRALQLSLTWPIFLILPLSFIGGFIGGWTGLAIAAIIFIGIWNYLLSCFVVKIYKKIKKYFLGANYRENGS